MTGVSLSRLTTAKGQLQRAVLELLSDHKERGELPTNARFVFYELEQAGIVSKVRTGARRPDQNVSEALMVLRENGLIPWRWIVDETRAVHGWQYAPSVYESVIEFIADARIDPWDGSPPLIICESRSLGGVLRPIVSEYGCQVAPTNGQCGGFLRTEVVPLLTANDRRVLYLGDYDLSGDQIEGNTCRVLVREADREIDWRRLAITAEQIGERGLTPIAKADRRYRPAREHEAWETEALGQTTVTALVREALEDLLPEPLDRVLVREAAQRQALAEFLAGGAAGVSSEADQLLTAEQLADRWQVKPGFVYELTRRGAIPAVRLGRYYR